MSLLYRYVAPDTAVHVSGEQVRLFEVAFTHVTAGSDQTYERLEFLGDAITSAALSSYIFRRFPSENEAFMTRLRAFLISGKVYAELSRQIGLPGWLRLGDRCEHLRARPEVQEDVYEAFVGAMFLSFGFAYTEQWVVRSLEEHTDISEIVRRVVNPRERLTNFCIAVHGAKPRIDVGGSGDDSFVAKVHHPATGALVAEGHAATSTRAIGDACDAAMDVIIASRVSAPELVYSPRNASDAPLPAGAQ